MAAKYDVERFTGNNDFGLWRLKMRVLLVHQSLDDALPGEDKMSKTHTEKDKKEILSKAHSAIILSLRDKGFRKVFKEKSVASICDKLEGLYMTKSLVNRLYLKHKMHSFRMKEGKSVEEQMDIFNKLVLDLENVDVSIVEEDQALLLLRSLLDLPNLQGNILI